MLRRKGARENKLSTITFLLSALVLILLFCKVQGSIWEVHFPNPTEAQINAGAYNPIAKEILLAGDEGLLLHSQDGENWEMCYSPVSGNYLFIMYTDTFYLVSEYNKERIALKLATDFDCHDTSGWERVNMNTIPVSDSTQVWPRGIFNSGATVYAAIFNQQLYTSLTGAIDDFQIVTSLQSYITLSVVTGDVNGETLWVAKLQQQASSTVFFTTSTTGYEWSSPVTSSGFTAKSYNNGLSYCSDKFVASFDQGIATSTDGITWTIGDPSFNAALHTISCIGDICVAASNTSIYDTQNCYNNWAYPSTNLDEIQYTFPIVAEFLEKVFMVGGNDALVEVLGSSEIWSQTCSNITQTQQFFRCTELIYSNDTFIVGCYQSFLTSASGVEWKKSAYTLPGTNDKQLSNITPNGNGWLLGEGEDDTLFLSQDNGLTWTSSVEIILQEDDDFDIFNIRATNNVWIAMADDLWPVSSSAQFTPYYEHDSSSLSVYNPFIVVSDSYAGSSWVVYGTDAWILDIFYSSYMGKYVGAGKNGIYTSENLYNWDRVKQSNGDCFAIAYDPTQNIVILCENENSNGNVDQIMYSSSNYGLDWTAMYNPCQFDAITCKYLLYSDSIGFLLYSADVSGTIYFSTDGVEWALVNFPYAMGIWGIASDALTIVTLTDEVLLSGEISSLATNGPFGSNGYNYSTTAPTRATFPVVGKLTSYPDDGSSDENGDEYPITEMSTPELLAVVLGSMIGVVIVFILIVLGVTGVSKVITNRKKGVFEDSALLAHDDL